MAKRMKPASHGDHGSKSRTLFITALWAAIAVALLSALVPLGPPASRLTGSAFNPATTDVVLKVRTQAVPAVAQVTEPDGDGRAPFSTPAAVWLLRAVASLLPGFFLLHAANRFSRGQPTPEPYYLLSRRRARAPPAFF